MDGILKAKKRIITTKEKKYSKMTMEELLKLQKDIGVKAFKTKVVKSDKDDNYSDYQRPKDDNYSDYQRDYQRPKDDNYSDYQRPRDDNYSNYQRDYQRPTDNLKDKDRPVEMPLMRKIAKPLWDKSSIPTQKQLHAPSRIARDPRFDDLSGKFDPYAFKKNYAFVADLRHEEKAVLEKELLRATPEDAPRMKLALKRMDDQDRERKITEEKRQAQKEERGAVIEALKQGRRPYTKKNSVIKMEHLAKQFDVLKKENRLDKYLERKEKKMKAKELFGK